MLAGIERRDLLFFESKTGFNANRAIKPILPRPLSGYTTVAIERLRVRVREEVPATARKTRYKIGFAPLTQVNSFPRRWPF
jgi:hypothetical protein